MAADFSVWDRATLEQFAREATAKLVENRKAISELVEALTDARGKLAETLFVFRVPIPAASFERYDAAIDKHSKDVHDAQKAGQSC